MLHPSNIQVIWDNFADQEHIYTCTKMYAGMHQKCGWQECLLLLYVYISLPYNTHCEQFAVVQVLTLVDH